MRRISKVLVVVVVAFAAALVAGTGVANAGQDKTVVCHVEGNGAVIAIEIADPAAPAHIDHGDALPGQPVPDMAGHQFDGSCSPVLIDSDSDGVGDLDDNCPATRNASQDDLDDDTIGDACDPDVDGDSYLPPGDCDDRSAGINPGAVDVPDDGIDQDCDGEDATTGGCDLHSLSLDGATLFGPGADTGLMTGDSPEGLYRFEAAEDHQVFFRFPNGWDSFTYTALWYEVGTELPCRTPFGFEFGPSPSAPWGFGISVGESFPGDGLLLLIENVGIEEYQLTVSPSL